MDKPDIPVITDIAENTNAVVNGQISSEGKKRREVHIGEGDTPKLPIQRAQSERFIDIVPTNFDYTKLRQEYGRQPQFEEDHDRIHVGLEHNDKLEENYEEMTITDGVDDTCTAQRSTTTNTDRAEYKSLSLSHTEGGWPKEINVRDFELVDRTKKKMQKDEMYIEAVPLMAKEADYLVRYNNTLPFYNRYYTKCNKNSGRDTKPRANVVSVYRCPYRKTRPVSKITFAPEGCGRMAVSYCPYEYDPGFRDHNCEAYFWEVECPTRPEGLVRAPAQIVDIRYHPKDVHNICGALFTGQVAKWDNRVGPNPQSISKYDVSHEDVCTSAMWINSKTGYEFFSCGSDGRVIWWDERNLSERLDYTYADPLKGRSEAEHAVPITVLDYEHTLPTKFLVGSQFVYDPHFRALRHYDRDRMEKRVDKNMSQSCVIKGQVMVFMKKGKTPLERLINMYGAHKGPVRSIHRNPVFIKNFMSCGDYHLRIFAEDCRDSGIMWTAPSDALYTYAQWLTGRPCGLVASRVDGCLEFWDLLIQGTTSMLTTKVSAHPLSTVWPADTGKHVAAGTVTGDIRMVKLCSSMYSFGKPDKSALAGCFDRESRREKYLEQRCREIRLAKKQRDGKQKEKEMNETDQATLDQQGTEPLRIVKYKRPEPFTNEHLPVDKNFFVTLAQEKKTQGINAFSDKKLAAKTFSEGMSKSRTAEKKRHLVKTSKTEDSTLNVQEVLGDNDETLRFVNEKLEKIDRAHSEADVKGEKPDLITDSELLTLKERKFSKDLTINCDG